MVESGGSTLEKDRKQHRVWQGHRQDGGIEAFLRQVVRRIVSVFPQVRQVVLFGSYASGKPTRDSDLDLFVVMPTHKRWSDRIRALHALFPDRPLPMDFVVRTPQEVRERLTSYFCPFTREVLQKGRILYETSSRRSRLGR